MKMNVKNTLIENYKNNLTNTNNEIVCKKNKDYYYTQKEFDSDNIIKDFFGKDLNNIPVYLGKNYSLNINYYIGNDNSKIYLCHKDIFLSLDVLFDEEIIIEKKKFLGFSYNKKTKKYNLSDKSLEQKQLLKDKGFNNSSEYNFNKKYYFIVFENLIFEITIDLFKELEMFTIQSLKERSLSNINFLK